MCRHTFIGNHTTTYHHTPLATGLDMSRKRYTHLLPIYVFPSHQVEVSGFIPPGEDAASTPKSPYPEARSQVAGFWRCGPHRAKFLAESVWDLKNTLEQAGSRLHIRVGQVTDVLANIFSHFEPDEDSAGKSSTEESPDPNVVGVWMAKDDGYEERQEAQQIRKVVEGSGREFRLFSDEKYYVHEYDTMTSLLSSSTSPRASENSVSACVA